MDNPEGQVTYPIRNRTAGLPTSSSTFLGVHCVFIFVFIIKPYGTINLIRQIQIYTSIIYILQYLPSFFLVVVLFFHQRNQVQLHQLIVVSSQDILLTPYMRNKC